MNAESSAYAALFHRLHQEGLLLLANVWDAGTARLVESLGAKAIATTSAGVAWSHGYADGNHLPVETLVQAVAEIVRVIRVPLTVDMEGGYSSDLARVGENVAAVVGAGAVGINLEDGLGGPELLCGKIERAKRAGERAGIDLFVNARTDVFVRNLVPAECRVEETVARARLYREVGADGIFALGVVQAAEISALVSAVGLPLNVLAKPGLPDAKELQALGVRRLSAGSGIPEVMYGRIAKLAGEFMRDGVSAPLSVEALLYRDINALIAIR